MAKKATDSDMATEETPATRASHLDNPQESMAQKIQHAMEKRDGQRTLLKTLSSQTNQKEYEVKVKEMEIQRLQEDLDQSTSTASVKQECLSTKKHRLDELSIQVQESSEDIVVFMNTIKEQTCDFDVKFKTDMQMSKDLSTLHKSRRALYEKKLLKDKEITQKEIELKALSKKRANGRQQHEDILEKIVESEKARKEDERKITGLMEKERTTSLEFVHLRREQQRKSRSNDCLQRNIENQCRKKEVLLKDADKFEDLINIQSASLVNLQTDITAIVKTVDQEKISLHRALAQHKELQNRNNKEDGELEDRQGQLLGLDDGIKKEKDKCTEVSSRIKQQQKMLSAAKMERNDKSKVAIEVKAECVEYKRQIEAVTKKIVHHKSDVWKKEQAMAKEHSFRYYTEKNVEWLQDEISKVQHSESVIAKNIETQKPDILVSAQQVCAYQARLFSLQNELKVAMKKNKRTDYNVVKVEKELEQEFDLIRLMSAETQQEEKAYRSYLQQASDLEIEISQLEDSKKTLEAKLLAKEESKRQNINTEHDLLGEKAKVNALSTALSTPSPLHPWRILEHSDPETSKLIETIQTMQARMLKCDAELQSLTREIGYKTRDYKKLQAKGTGEEELKKVNHNLGHTQKNFRQKICRLNKVNCDTKSTAGVVVKLQEDLARLQNQCKNLSGHWLEEQLALHFT
jgi:hypothetical protein